MKNENEENSQTTQRGSKSSDAKDSARNFGELTSNSGTNLLEDDA